MKANQVIGGGEYWSHGGVGNGQVKKLLSNRAIRKKKKFGQISEIRGC